jgi:hypothetical protein
LAYSISAAQLLAYPPESIRAFHRYSFECVDNLLFVRRPSELLSTARAAAYVAVARETFLAFGWAGDGEIGLLWVPGFTFPIPTDHRFLGAAVWHVKQENDGISFLLSPVALPFPALT